MKRLKTAWLNLAVRLYLKYPRLVGFLNRPNVPEFLSLIAFMISTGA